MKTKISKQITYWLGVAAVGLVAGIGIQFVQAWTEPTVAPPGGNLGAPINTSDNYQWKEGNLMLNSSGTWANGLIVANGNVGIGTASPQVGLHVKDATSSAEPSILIERNSSSAAASPRIGFADTKDGAVTTVPAWFVDNLDDQFRIFRQDNISTSVDDRWDTHLKILNDGRVGIGNNAPAWMLDVQSENGSRINLEKVTNTSTPSVEKRISMRLDGSAVDLSWSGADMYIAAMGENRSVFINPNGGNVGIGTTNPGTNKLEVVGGPTKTTGGLIIETRTASQGSPTETGRMWLCTDC